jgi:hypothetical protein
VGTKHTVNVKNFIFSIKAEENQGVIDSQGSNYFGPRKARTLVGQAASSCLKAPSKFSRKSKGYLTNPNRTPPSVQPVMGHSEFYTAELAISLRIYYSEAQRSSASSAAIQILRG